MKSKYILLKSLSLLLLIIIMASCEEDFSTIDTSLIGENLEPNKTTFPVIAYSKKLGAVQTNALAANKLGVYSDPVFGKTKSSFLTQVTLAATDPDFGDCTVLDSVVLYLPFFSTATTSDDEVTYEVDSIYGNEPINLNVYHSNYFLRDLDPTTDFEEPQNYYSNFKAELTPNLGELLGTVENFLVNDKAVVLNDSVSLPPGLRVKLSKDFFQEKILDQEGNEVLLNNNNFKDFFRGIYIEANSENTGGNHFIFDPVDSNNDNIGITLFTSYKDLPEETTPCETDSIERKFRQVRLLFNANTVNVIENESLSPTIENAVTNPNKIEGEENLYTRGGEGIVSIINLFNDPEELAQLREEKWIINEANLVFYVDQDKVTGGDKEPERIIIFDIKNHSVLADFSIDPTSSNEAIDAFTQHLGRLERDSDEKGEFYKLKLTAHVSNIINRDSTNTPLGLMVTKNVLQTDFQDIETPCLVFEDATNSDNNIYLEQIPNASIISSEGTVLHGNRSSNQDKRLKLEVYYTKPE